MAIKFGAQAAQSGVTWEELLSLWQELDRDSSFDHLWLMDHFVTGAGAAADAGVPRHARRPPISTLGLPGPVRARGACATWSPTRAAALPITTTRQPTQL